MALVLALSMLMAACSAGSDADRPNGSAPPADRGPRVEITAPATTPERDPRVEITELSKQQWARMVRAGMVRQECPIQVPAMLRVVAVDHYDFQGRIKRGRLVVNADVADSIARIFTRLYKERFPIRQMVPVERFGGDVDASLRADNTSAFNCRRADQINAPFADSPHANGRAIDINPRENPWMDLRCDCWLPSAEYQKRVDRPGSINRGGLVWRLFRQEGWIWQNIDVPDYMHFDTGYPSRPFPEQAGNVKP